MPECVFCQIIKRKARAKIEYEDEEVIAFWDIKPAAPIHILIVPKKHIESINEIKKEDQSLIGKLVFVAKKLAQKKEIEKSGFRLIINTGPWSGQIVPHLHVHLLGGGA
jgi:histidine triad (HIT) family protein